jgi:hypothetical protein
MSVRWGPVPGATASSRTAGDVGPADARRASSPLARWWHGRFGPELLKELTLVVGLYLVYRLGRTITRDDLAAATDHARQVLALERFLGIANERGLQAASLDHVWLIKGLNRYYVTVHFPLTVAFLIIAYVRDGACYRHLRTVFGITTALALVLHVAYPLAPPRFLPGYVDTVAVWGPRVYESAAVQSQANQLAAMPSLHFGWALLVAYGVILLVHHPVRWLALAHPVVTLLAITITANHYWLDAVVAALLVALAWVVANLEVGRVAN